MTIQDLREQKLIIFEAVVGSQAYGIATPESDTDVKGVFIQPIEDILSFGYRDQVNDSKNDTVFYEVRRFLQLLSSNNPTVLELLYIPEDCIIYKDSIFDKIIAKRSLFITKVCKMSFGGYAIQQIKKAKGMNKKIVKPMDKNRKGVLDFCYVPDGQGSIPVKEYLEERGMKQKFCGLVVVPHMRYVYSVFYDKASELREKGIKIPGATKYKGIVQDEVESNDVSVSSVEKADLPFTIMSFNKDGYSTYCKEYKEYHDWVENRSQSRFSDNMVHGKGYDGKNLAHCHRLLDMAIEIGEGKGINVRRQNREILLSIRKGEYEYETLVKEAEEKIQKMDIVFEASSLPEEIDLEEMKQLLLEIRKEKYGL
jgi:hypothetical protein